MPLASPNSVRMKLSAETFTYWILDMVQRRITS